MADWLARLREWLELHLNWKSLGIAIAVIAVCAFFGGTVYEDWQADHAGLTLVDEAPSANDEAPSASKETNTPKATGEVKVHVVGAVTAAGVYTLPADARVDDAVRAAGATADADLSQLNLAQKLSDGQKITVPKVGKPPLLKPPPVQAVAATVPYPMSSRISIPLPQKSYKIFLILAKYVPTLSLLTAKNTAALNPLRSCKRSAVSEKKPLKN